VFELLACGTAVLSTPSRGMEEMLDGVVAVTRGEEEAREQLERLLDDGEYRESLTRRGSRLVLARHTYRDRLAEVARVAGFEIPAGAGEETAVLVAADEPSGLSTTIDSLLTQSLAPDEVLLGLSDGALAERDLDRLAERFGETRIRTISQNRDASRSVRLRELARLAAAPWVAPLEPGVAYDPDHLRDLVACTRFAGAEVIGFGTGGNGGAHRYAEAVPPHAALVAHETVTARGWPPDEAEMRRWFEQGVRIYAGEAREPAAA
jgi:hypothetical protein